MRDFDLARRERAAKRLPVQFRLGGEDFTLLPVVPLGAAFDLHDAPDVDLDRLEEGDEALMIAVRALSEFIEQCLISEDVPRWQALIRRRDDPIDPWAIIDCGAYVAEAYSGRPTLPSIASSSGRRRGGRSTSQRGRKAS